MGNSFLKGLNVFLDALKTPTTQGEFLSQLASILPEDNVERKFVEWVVENKDDLPTACRELGVEPPEEGPKLLQRLRNLIGPKL